MGVNGVKVAKLISRAAEGNWNPEYGTNAGHPFGGLCLAKDLKAFDAFLRKIRSETSEYFRLLQTLMRIYKLKIALTKRIAAFPNCETLIDLAPLGKLLPPQIEIKNTFKLS